MFLPQIQGYRYILQHNLLQVFGEVIWNLSYTHTCEIREN